MNFPSKLIEDAVQAFKKLPGIGEKTALRLVLHLLKEDEASVEQFGSAVVRLRKEIKYCKICHNISDHEKCSICVNASRDQKTLCVVENFREVLAIENTGIFNGRYHILGGVISPMDGIGPDQLNLDSLIERIKSDQIEELILALNPTMEGDTTIYFISRQLKDVEIKITTISRGVAFGGDLEYTDELTLSRAIATRLPFERYLVNR